MVYSKCTYTFVNLMTMRRRMRGQRRVNAQASLFSCEVNHSRSLVAVAMAMSITGDRCTGLRT